MRWNFSQLLLMFLILFVGCMYDPRFDWDPNIKRLGQEFHATTIPNRYGFVSFSDSAKFDDAQFAKALPLLKGHGVTELQLVNTDVTDASVSGLVELKNIKWLDISGTWITADGVTRLAALQRLTFLVVSPDHVPAQGVAELQRALPKTEISVESRLARSKRSARQT